MVYLVYHAFGLRDEGTCGGTVFEFGDVFCFTYFLSVLFYLGLGVGLGLRLGSGVVLGLGLGLVLALGLGEGWVLYISTRIYLN